MKWIIFFSIALGLFASAVTGALILSRSRYKSGRILQPSNVLFIGVILSATLMFIPIYHDIFPNTAGGAVETVLVSIHNMIRLFIVDGEFDFVINGLAGAPAGIVGYYSVFFAVLFVSAPILTFGFVLSFFKNLSAYKRYITHFRSDVFVFSELNERAMALATSLYANDKKHRFFVFTDVFESNDEQSYELVEQAMELDAILFKKDMVAIKLFLHSKKNPLSFILQSYKRQVNYFVIGEDQTENISQTLHLIEKYKYRDNTNIYLFSTQPEAEILLSNAFEDDPESDGTVRIKVRRVNEVQSLIGRTLYEQGYEKIFGSAYEDGNVKRINAVIIGMGRHGTEMLKALTWFCQMDGYEVRIDAFDKDEMARERFSLECPELLFYGENDYIPGEAKYTLGIYPKINVDTIDILAKAAALPRATYVFIALGDDEKNISTAIKLRSMYERLNYHPVIQTVVYNNEKNAALNNTKNFKGIPYDIDYIGDRKTSYSESIILDSELEKAALERHLKWGRESDFWRYDYNYKSSVASAIHRRMKALCGIAGIEKSPEDRTEEELWAIRRLEHRRWNAYMRSEGFVYGGTVEKHGRNDLAKTHNCLVPFDDLPLAEQIKDDD